jgi:nucleoid DNA-binding protein
MEVLPVFLKLEQSVNLEGFGTFRVFRLPATERQRRKN